MTRNSSNAGRLDSGRAGWLLALVFVCLAAGIVAAGYFYYLNYGKNYRSQVERQLSAIAELKVDEITQWRKERLGDGATLFKNAAFSSLVRRVVEKPVDTEAQRQLQAWCEEYQTTYQYDLVRLVDVQGVTLVSVPTDPAPMSSTVSRRIPEVLRSGEVTFQDFYRNEHDQRVYWAVLVPILYESEGSPPLGVLVLRVDPAAFFYPFIQRWPAPSTTAETLLVRREGNEVVFLNELRFQKDTALTLRRPLNQAALPAARAALGQEGVMEGIDYRGVPVVAALRAIPDSPWSLVARMDAAEVYAPLRERLWQMVVLIGALLFSAGAGVGLVWRRQRVRFYRERYEAAEALRASSAYVRSLIEASLDPLVTISAEGKITDVNEASVQATGVARASLIGTDFSDYFTEPEKAREGYQRAFSERFVRDYPLAIRHISGRVTDVLYNASVFRDEQGQVLGVFAAARDITQRKQAEASLAKQRALLEGINQVLRETIRCETEAELAAKCLAVAENLTGSQFGFVDELSAAGTVDTLALTDPGWAACRMPETDAVRLLKGLPVRGIWAVAIKTGEPVIANDPASHPDRVGTPPGHPPLIRFLGVPLKLDGKPIGLIGLGNKPSDYDLDDQQAVESLAVAFMEALLRKRAAETLRMSEERFRIAAETANDVVYEWDLKQSVQWPGKIDEMLGYESGEFPRTLDGWAASVHPEDLKRVMAAVQAHLEGPAVYGEEYRVRTKDGVYRWWSARGAAARTPEGKPVRWVGTVTDITERKRAEEEIRQLNTELEQRVRERTAELEAANKELEAFAYSASHDLRAPLRGIDGFSRILLEDYGDKLDDEGKDSLARVRAASQRMAQLIDDLLKLSHAARTEMRRVAVDLTALAGEIAAELRRADPARPVRWVIARALAATGDPQLLRVALDNLLNNAWKFTSLQKDACIEFGITRTKGGPAFFIRDNGVGFDMTYADKLFGPFQRLHATADFPGTGIGLATVQRIIHRHGGRVWAEGRTNHGATFYFTLPENPLQR